MTPVTDLTPGDSFTRAHDRWLDDTTGQPLQVRVTVLRAPEEHIETVGPLAGRPGIRVWCRREDTGVEGYMSYGPAATISLDTATHETGQ